MNIKENFDVIIFFIIIKYKIYYFFNYLHFINLCSVQFLNLKDIKINIFIIIIVLILNYTR